ncbi:hypothetical protein VNO77_06421 [Canavalia gladiata]|uniref:Uncharacterized protein n=1 Tax=Canavalia gladiata TaxID=3824 RepID=A0AAN9M858_CANGL
MSVKIRKEHNSSSHFNDNRWILDLYLYSHASACIIAHVVTVGKFQGGSAFNVILDSVTNLRQCIEQVITGHTAVHRCNATINFFDEDKPVINDGDLHKHFYNVAGKLLGIDKVHDMKPKMGAEDFSFYQEAMPGYFFDLGMKNASHERLPGLH